MKRFKIASAALLALAACSGNDTTIPSGQPGAGPSFIISDATHSSGNPDFFFLPPMVPDPSGSPLFQAGAFNGGLAPTVTICALDLAPAAPESAVLPGTPCKGSPTVFSGAAIKVQDQQYQTNWKVPSSADTYYRIVVAVGATPLGMADVHSGANGSQLKNVNTGQFVSRVDGSTLPIKFRIERYALCSTPGVGPCGTATIPLSTGGHVEFPGPDGHTVGAVTIPAQLPASPAVTVTVQPCAGGASLPIDLPKFGGCVSVTTDPAGLELTNAATVEICNLGSDLDLSGLTPAQKARVTLHRQSTDLTVLQALPHVAGCAADAAVHYSVGGLLRELVHGNLHRAGLQLFGLVAPQALNALDVGAGGMTFAFSNFQFALPAKMQILSGDGQTALPGTTVAANPTVIVTDLADQPVRNATVNFAASAGGSVGAASVVTDAAGHAAVTWTLASAPGANSLVASGRGIADPVNNGPRSIFDPFMSIQSAFNPSAEVIPNPLQPVNLQTGSVTFGATGASPSSPLPVNYGSAGWSYQVGGSIPADWFSNLVSPFSLTAPAGFGFNDTTNNCPLVLSSTSTAWSPNTTLYARRNISLSTGATIQISVAIDNDIEIYVDGVNVGPGTLVHEGCPTQGSFVRTVTLPAGTHVVAFKAIDRGGSSYFDAEITIAPPPPIG